MISSVVNVYQLALDAVGSRTNISLTTEASREAEVCNRWYDSVRDTVFRAAFWASTKKTARLSVLAERDFSLDWTTTDPDPPYTYAYALPTDLLAARYLSSFGRFSLAYHNNTRVALHTDVEDAILFYSFRNENPAAWDTMLQMAVVYGLAGMIALPLSGKPTRTKFLLDRANRLILDAQVAFANEDHEHYETVPTWISARGYGNIQSTTRYIVPYGPLLGLPGDV